MDDNCYECLYLLWMLYHMDVVTCIIIRCPVLDVSSVQSVLMRHFIEHIISLCHDESEEHILEKYLLSGKYRVKV